MDNWNLYSWWKKACYQVSVVRMFILSLYSEVNGCIPSPPYSTVTAANEPQWLPPKLIPLPLGQTVEFSLFALTVNRLHGWGPLVPSSVPVNLWWGFGLFPGKLLWLKFAVCETDLSSSWKLLGVCHIGANRSFLCGRWMPFIEKEHWREKEAHCEVGRQLWLGWWPWRWDYVAAEGFSQAQNDPWNIVWILRLDVSAFSFNKVLRIYIFKVHCFKLKSHLNEERNDS